MLFRSPSHPTAQQGKLGRLREQLGGKGRGVNGGGSGLLLGEEGREGVGGEREREELDSQEESCSAGEEEEEEEEEDEDELEVRGSVSLS